MAFRLIALVIDLHSVTNAYLYSKFSKILKIFALYKLPKFHLIFWCGICVEMHSFYRVSEESPNSFQGIARGSAATVRFQKKLHPRKLGKITVFYAVLFSNTDLAEYIFTWFNKTYHECVHHSKISVFRHRMKVKTGLLEPFINGSPHLSQQV